ncbi:HU family DNA-binding protein [Alicyclobacillus fastidiosus]|uniref:HU family DNA-binding protein n=1 Tax=Alicyclobacillus fastidiosus TaxID=392011 RepID=A0ABY6ZKZ2_9BACL|nr:HU family DNA-binding protein [Alicyclobacillus fastidiosus]WAH43509.1 HU family DNA-binding protein [Alicyclobacillus fastidiosus]GMA59670.1 transcriptional regulator [Alicyclobacillus fastidiosus]
MNKQELINKAAEKTGLTKKDTETLVNGLFGVIEETLGAGEKVQIPGFGTFEVRERAARTGRNPQTGETIDIAASKVPVFKPGSSLKEKVQQ